MKSTTYTKITAKIITMMLIFTLVASFFYGEYIKREAISNLAQIDARKTSSLVFESLYSAMAKGWNKDELKEIVDRLNRVDKKMNINVYRGELVSQLYGEIERDKIARESSVKIKRALHGKEILDVINDDTIIYYFPVLAKDECLKCHTNAKVDNVLGVINISYPVDELKVSLNQMINFFIGFIILFSFVMFLVLFLNFRRYLLRPMKNFISLVDSIKSTKDLGKRVHVGNNIEEIKSMQSVFNSMLDTIEYQFYNDELTNLKNRRAILEAIDENLESLLMIINIDSFQELNNLYGNKTGDRLLVEISSFIKELLPEKSRFYRLHADEFGFLSTGLMDLDEFEMLASYIISSLENKKFQVDEQNHVNISVTIGISYGTLQLLPNADIALKIAKKEKKHQLTWNESMQAMQKFETNFNWRKRLNKALENDKIVPLFQPIARCEDGKIVKYEALMRIVDENGEYISPIHFLNVAKKNKIYHKLTKTILAKSFEEFRDSKHSFSINLSVEDMLNSEVINFIIKNCIKYDIGDRLIVEIIESEGINNFEEVISFIDKVKECGVRISIDDFGTGYSNFEYLIKLKVDYLKIDGSMIKNINTDNNSKAVVQTIVDFAKKIEVETVAEYVYSKAIFDTIKELGIDYAQGYYFGQPTSKVKH